jgi:hypothetical protein
VISANQIRIAASKMQKKAGRLVKEPLFHRHPSESWDLTAFSNQEARFQLSLE